jgi:hypothetical protein
MGFALPGDRLHAPNERAHLPTLRRGIDSCIPFLARLPLAHEPARACTVEGRTSG